MTPFIRPTLLLAVALALACGVTAQETAPPARVATEYPTEIRLAVDQPRVSDDIDAAAIRNVLQRRLELFGEARGDVVVRSPLDIRVRVDFPAPTREQLHRLASPGRLELRRLQGVQSPGEPNARYAIDMVEVFDARAALPFRFRFRDRRSGGLMPQSELDRFLEKQPLIFTQADIVPGTPRRLISGVLLAVTFRLRESAAKLLARETGGKYTEALATEEQPARRANPRRPVNPKKRLKQYEREQRARLKQAKFMAWIIDGELVGVPLVQAPIVTGEVQMMAGFRSDEDARMLAVVLNSGALPAPLKVVAVESTPAAPRLEGVPEELLPLGVPAGVQPE